MESRVKKKDYGSKKNVHSVDHVFFVKHNYSLVVLILSQYVYMMRRWLRIRKILVIAFC